MDAHSKILVILMTCLSTVISGCPPQPMTPDPNATCESMCDHWRKLGCDEADPTNDGGTCEDVCVNVQGSGIVKWNLPCRATVRICDDIDQCESP